ncbi:TfoX/Sxy family protein [Iamia sp. SCSIO 61187]|uniref:TfoX/Sxy family protein n=1 Tax=Iamia sp. SCSIO 61187 TaxID=2722752 RepID=UPI001C626476|nr:TfoX/Sxy family protein [Iamia sp. SCSIO 61187]QYG94907.1 TfoX/Sxy family protein [Iamia sp. SCSIO 61187]
MAYDEGLAARIRDLLQPEPGITERAMFGGLAFLVDGNMAVTASGQGGAMVRVDPADAERLVASTPAEPMEMRGRPMGGWLRVAGPDLDDDDALEAWVGRGVATARALPPKG